MKNRLLSEQANLNWTIDGNDSAEKFFLLPIGMRDCALPENLSEMRCDINVKMLK